MLPPEAIKEFKQIYFIEEGKVISDQEAVALANNLLSLFRNIYKDKTGKKFEQPTVSHKKI